MSVSWRDARDQLRKMREDSSDDSEKIIQLAEPLLKSSASSLGNGVYAIYEQACVAALDCAKDDLAMTYFKKLEGRFGKESSRVGLLKAQILEAGEKWAEANTLYENLLEADPTNANIMKRQVAAFIAKGDNTDAIKHMNKYLENFMCDFEAWMELALLYLNENRYTDAKFCFEELILSNPYNYIFHQRYAEVCYTIGDAECTALARKHFAQALKLHPKCARAMFGLLLITRKAQATSSAKSSASSANSNNGPVAKHCETALTSLHSTSPTASLVDGFIKLIAK
eukprot:m.178656 g.178656  ORF g.178656 m.178656 type:complete len:284 (-) comp31949_c3_seq1:94-945(-)